MHCQLFTTNFSLLFYVLSIDIYCDLLVIFKLNMNSTEIKTENFESSISWTISNFSSLTKQVQSQKNKNGDIEWYINLCPYDKDKTYISIFLYVITQNSVEVDYEITLKDKNEKCLDCFELGYIFDKKHSNWGASKFTKRKNILPLSEDILIIKLHISLKLCNGYESLKFTCYDLFQHMSNNFDELYSSGSLSDVTLQASDGCKFPVHKCILGAHSPVFKVMFEHVKKESQENKVFTLDLNSNVVKMMLKFIYSHGFDGNEVNLDELLIASDKYDMSLLKKMCEMELCNRLTVQNSIDYLILANNHQAQELERYTLNFIKLNLKDLKKNNILKKLDSKPILLRKILENCI